MDVVGPMARTSTDTALLLSYLAGRDEEDATTLGAPDPPGLYPVRARAGRTPLSGTRIGVLSGIRDAFGGAVDPEILSALDRAAADLGRLGATIVNLAGPPDAGVTEVLSVLATEGSAYHAQFADRADRYRPATASYLAVLRAAAASTSSIDYVNAQRARTRYVHAWEDAMRAERLDLVLMPTLGRDVPERTATGEYALMTAMQEGVLTGNWSWTGFPVVAVPAGRHSGSGMPIGMQLVGTAYREEALLQVAVDFQAHTDHHTAAPSGLDSP
jgi:aspartyl-tRNA(Asn)/glutamyl-tRNA(Gln) amidotransferase subunit A